MAKRVIFVAFSYLLFGCGHSPSSRSQGSSVDCGEPPQGVIRFALLSGADRAMSFEWSGAGYRRVGSEPTGGALIQKFPEGSVYKWNHWGKNVAAIRRDISEAEELISPYAWTHDSGFLVAGLVAKGNDDAPRTMAILRAEDQRITSTIEMEQPIFSVAWSPNSDAIVILTAAETYERKRVREKLASSIGHPIPYSEITLSILGRDGKVVCSITPATDLDYGIGYVRWDAQ